MALNARENVQLTLPADENQAARTVRALALTATGDPEDPARGLTEATFTGNVEYREKSETVDREAHAASWRSVSELSVSAFDDAASRAAHFADQRITGARLGPYDVGKGTLALSGSEPGSPRPHVFDDQIAVDASGVNVALAGPSMEAWGDVRACCSRRRSPGESSTKLPSMLKQDQAVTITGESLNYDGVASRAVYDGSARLWQGDTSIKADSIGIDDRSGDLSPRARSSPRRPSIRRTKTRKRTHPHRGDRGSVRVRRRPPPGRVPWRSALQRRPGRSDCRVDQPVFEIVRQRARSRRGSGSQEWTPCCESKVAGPFDPGWGGASADDRYSVGGAHTVSLTDQCGRVTSGRTLTFRKATDTIEVDGNQRVRTQTKNGEKCQVTTR